MKFVNKYWRLIFILVVTIVLILWLKSCKKQLKTDTAVQYAISNKLDSFLLKRWTDKYNKEHVIAENNRLEKEKIERYADSVSSLLKIKNRQLIASSQTATQIVVKEKLRVDTITTVLPSGETSNTYNFKWNDSWMNVKGSIGETDSIFITGTDTLSRVDYWKRKWFLGKKHWYTDISNSNPHIKTTGYLGVSIKENTKKWSIGLSGQIGYQLNQPFQYNKPTFSLGISLQRSIVRF